MSSFKIALVLMTTYLIVGVSTLSHYGINWDTINHLTRGQSYLHFFLTGNKDFSDLTPWKKYWQQPESLFISSNVSLDQVPKRSIYESDATTFNWFINNESGGHPPLSDILASLFNQIFFKELRLVNDIDSYRIYSVFLAACLVGLIFWWSDKVYGRLAAFIATLSLSVYPLFWSELHFNNEKDIPETVFWSFMMFSIWRGITYHSWRWILISGIFFGLALGTKFNVLFAIFVILPWLVINTQFKLLKDIKRYIDLMLASVLSILLGLALFFLSWPYLWVDPIAGINKVIMFYKGIGLTASQDPRFVSILGANSYPAQWIMYTTPLPILLLAIIGIVVATYRFRSDNKKTSLLFLLWLLVPIARVSWPGTTIYGGIRQIMEYIPALAILSGVGGSFVIGQLAKMKLNAVLGTALVIVFFVPIFVELKNIHPNENVYFNELIGGLSGAKQRNFPAWGNSFGAAYRQGVVWMNNNAEENAKLVLVDELLPNIPSIFLREDIIYQNRNRSGYLRLGEYAMTLVYQGVGRRSYYDEYLEKFIEPVYQVQVDNTAILKIWKNDEEHLKLRWKEEIVPGVEIMNTSTGLRFDLGSVKKLSRLEIKYSEKECKALSSGHVRISKNGIQWDQLVGVLPVYWKVSILGSQPSGGQFIEPFVGQDARYIELVYLPKNACISNIIQSKVYVFI